MIFENKPDKASDLAAVLRAWALEKTEQGEMEVVLEKCVKSYTRFKTKRMSEIMPDAENSTSGWGTKNYYFYEIRNNEGNEFFIQLSLSSKDIPEHLREMCDRINVHFPSRQQKANWQWRIPFVTKHSKVGEEISEDKVFEQLNKRFEEIKAFEDKLIAFLDGSMIQE